MTLVAKVTTVAPIGFNGHIIEVESDTAKGLPSLQIVGMGNKAIDEAKERVRSAIANSLLEYPARRITINLAPAELPKDGTHYDLPIALSILTCSGQLRQEDIHDAAFAGELALDGSIRPVKGAVIMAEAARKNGISTLYLPVENSVQAALIDGISIIGVTSLKDLFLHLKGERRTPPVIAQEKEAPSQKGFLLDDIVGQAQAKRALIIAAAGRHNLLLSGPPGTGKTMLAKTLANLLPPLTIEERIEVTKIHSLADETADDIILNRPFRSPHHSASRASLTGGGGRPRPGDVSLAHLGVLFLDEIPEYPRSLLEALRQPLEDKEITISRANGHITYPADFTLIATMNPCPCGFYGDTLKECNCSSMQVLAYQKKLSGPFLDRIDMTLAVPRISHEHFLKAQALHKEQHKKAQKSVEEAKFLQFKRYNSSGKYNGNVTNGELKNIANISQEAIQILSLAAERLQLSARSYFKVIRVARTIADLENNEEIRPNHITEALQYRQKA